MHAWVSHLCMHKRVEAHVHVRCPSVATADDHMHLTGQMTRTKNHTHSVCTILHMHKVRGGGCVCLMGDIPVVSFTLSITKMQIKMIKLDPCEARDPI